MLDDKGANSSVAAGTSTFVEEEEEPNTDTVTDVNENKAHNISEEKVVAPATHSTVTILIFFNVIS